MYHMNSVNIALDVFCILISLIICFYLLNRKLTNTESRAFFKINIFNIIFILGDLSDWCCNGLKHNWYPAVLHIGQFVYYLSIIPLLSSLLHYIHSYLSSYNKLSKNYFRIISVLSVIHIIGSVMTPFTGWYYKISADNIYSRGDLNFITHVIPITTYLMVIFMTVKCRKLLNTRTIIAFLSYAWLPLFGQMIQVFFRGIGTLVPAITISLLFIFINVQLDREVMLEKKKQELADSQMKVMLSQIQPHFLYNVLTSIRYLCDTNPAKAKESIDSFSLFLRANMDAISTTAPIPLEQELDCVNHYLLLEQQRFGDTIQVEFDLQTTDFCVPILSLQTIVENAIRHGIRQREDGGIVRISTTEDDDFYYLIVEDNGIGFATNVPLDDKHVGIANTRKRLQLLCNGILTIESTINVGTKVILSIPKEY